MFKDPLKSDYELDDVPLEPFKTGRLSQGEDQDIPLGGSGGFDPMLVVFGLFILILRCVGILR